MIIRKTCFIICGLLGLGYTYLGMKGAYATSPALLESPGMLVLQFLIFSAFVVPFFGCIGLGVGLLIECIVGLFKSAPPKKEA